MYGEDLEVKEMPDDSESGYYGAFKVKVFPHVGSETAGCSIVV